MSWAQNQQLTVVCVGFVLCTGKNRVSEDLCACAQWGPGRSAGGSTRGTSKEATRGLGFSSALQVPGLSTPTRGPRATRRWRLGAHAGQTTSPALAPSL